MKSPYALPIFISLSLVLGMIIGLETAFPIKPVLIGLILRLALTVAIFFRTKRLFFVDNGVAIAALIAFVMLGMTTVKLRDPQADPSHYLHRDLRSPVTLKLRIREVLKPNPYYQAYVARVERLNDANTSGKILLSLKIDSTVT